MAPYLRAVLAVLLSSLLVSASAAADTGSQTFTGTVSSTGTATKTWSFNVTQTGTINVSLDWTTTSANLDVFLVQPSGGDVAKAVSTTNRPETISFNATQTGSWKIRVRATSGTSDYTADVTYPVQGSTGGIATFHQSWGFNGPAGLYGYGMDWDKTDNTILVADYWNYRVWRYTTDGHLVGLVSQHALGGQSGGITAPYDVEADTTDLDAQGHAAFWVGDQGSSRIVEFDHNGKWLQTIGLTNAGQATGTDATHPGHGYAYGCGAGQMHIPTHVLVDSVMPTHYIYVSDPNCRAVYIFDHQGGYHGALDWSGFAADTGVGTPVPRGVAEDENGYIYVAEFNSRRIAVFNPAGHYIGSSPRQADMNDVRGIDIDQTNHLIYTVGAFWNRVYAFSYDPTSHAVKFVNEWRNIDGTNNATNHAPFDSIRFPAVDGQGNVYVGDTWGCPAYASPCAGKDPGYGVIKFTPNPVGATQCDTTNAATAVATCAGATADPWNAGSMPPPAGGFNQQNGIAVDPTDTDPLAGMASPFEGLYVVDTFEQRVQEFNTTKTCTSSGACTAWVRQWGSRQPASPTSDGFGYPRALTFGDDGRIWVGDNNNAVLAFQPDGTFVHRFGSQGAAPGQFKGGVQGVRVQGGRVYATDAAGCHLQVFDTAKLLTVPSGSAALEDVVGTTCGTGAGQMNGPRGIAVDPSDPATVYVINSYSSTLTKWHLNLGAPGSFNGGGTSTLIRPSCNGQGLSGPWGITYEDGWYYIGDVKNNRVVRWQPDGTAAGVCQIVVQGTNSSQPGYVSGMLGSNYVEFGADPLPSVHRMYISDNSRRILSFDIMG